MSVRRGKTAEPGTIGQGSGPGLGDRQRVAVDPAIVQIADRHAAERIDRGLQGRRTRMRPGDCRRDGAIVSMVTPVSSLTPEATSALPTASAIVPL